MKKIVFIGFCFLLFSCQKKEVLLPQIPETIVTDVKDHSPIYMFFKTKGKDTLVEVNRKNSIISTNWLFNIDKRLPLRLVVPEIQKLQAKKENSEHKNAAADNYFTYMDSLKRTLAFLPFTGVEFKTEKPTFGVLVYFNSKNELFVNDVKVKKDVLQEYLNNMESDKPNKFQYCFSKDISFDKYIQSRILLRKLKFYYPRLQKSNIECIY